MFKRIKKQSKESVGIALERLAGSAWRGVGALLGFVAGLEKEGKSEYREYGEIKGKTQNGKDIKGGLWFSSKNWLESQRIFRPRRIRLWRKEQKEIARGIFK